MVEEKQEVRYIMEILSVELDGDTVRFSMKYGTNTVTSLVRNVGESLLFGKLIRMIHDNDGFYKGFRWMLRQDGIAINQVRFLLNDKLKELI